MLPSYESVKLYVGQPSTIFRVAKDAVAQSPVLEKVLCHEPGEGWYIMSPMLSKFDAKVFRSVVDFLTTANYYHSLVGTPVRVRSLTSQGARAAYILRNGLVYQIAGRLQLRALQDLVAETLRVLSTHPATEFLTIATTISAPGAAEDAPIWQVLVDHIADHYWDLQKADSKRFLEVMMACPELDRRVTARRARGPRREVVFVEDDDD